MKKTFLIITTTLLSLNCFALDLKSLAVANNPNEALEHRDQQLNFNTQDLLDKAHGTPTYKIRRRKGNHPAYRQHSRKSPTMNIDYEG